MAMSEVSLTSAQRETSAQRRLKLEEYKEKKRAANAAKQRAADVAQPWTASIPSAQPPRATVRTRGAATPREPRDCGENRHKGTPNTPQYCNIAAEVDDGSLQCSDHLRRPLGERCMNTPPPISRATAWQEQIGKEDDGEEKRNWPQCERQGQQQSLTPVLSPKHPTAEGLSHSPPRAVTDLLGLYDEAATLPPKPPPSPATPSLALAALLQELQSPDELQAERQALCGWVAAALDRHVNDSMMADSQPSSPAPPSRPLLSPSPLQLALEEALSPPLQPPSPSRRRSISPPPSPLQLDD